MCHPINSKINFSHCSIAGAYLKPSRTLLLTIFAEKIVDVRLGCKYASDVSNFLNLNELDIISQPDPHKIFLIKEIGSRIFYTTSQYRKYSQLAFTCSKLTIETLKEGVKYVQY